MDELYEKIGRQHLDFERQDAAYTALLNLLAGVIGGTIDRSPVTVNLTDRRWSLCPEGESAATPGTVNGLPVCVIAPPPPAAGPEVAEAPKG